MMIRADEERLANELDHAIAALWSGDEGLLTAWLGTAGEPGPALRDWLRAPTPSFPRTLAPSTRVAGYTIHRELGRGGMGVVYEAEQDVPRRRVALKVIGARREPDEVDLRVFRREIQILARLTHPSIATIHDAGETHDGRPFFAMEKVEGERLDLYLKRHPEADLATRLLLFRRICAPIAFAHRRGVIHRDLKPSNVMVEPDGTPRIVDFGLARLLESDGDDSLTLSGIVGTLPYMSPEQVRGGDAEVDVRSDVYTLGVLLFEMLTGRLPYPIDGRRPLEAARTILEREPDRPTGEVVDISADVAAVVLKALEKDPDRRYSVVDELDEDVRRCLEGLPVSARPQTTWYRFGRFARRRKTLVAAVAAMAIIFLVGAVVVVTSLVQSRASERRAQQSNREARATIAFLKSVFEDANPFRLPHAEITLLQAVDLAKDRIEEFAGGEPAVEAEVRALIGNAYGSLGRFEAGEMELRRALALRQQIHLEAHPDLATSHRNLGFILHGMKRYDEAERAYRTSLAMRRELLGESHPATEQVREELGCLLRDTNRRAEALALFEENVSHARAAIPPDAPRLALRLNMLGRLYVTLERWQRGISAHEEALELLVGKDGPHPALWADSRAELGNALKNANRLEEAQACYEEAIDVKRRQLGGDHASLAAIHRDLVSVYQGLGDLDAAVERIHEMLRLYELWIAPDHSLFVAARILLAKNHRARGEFQLAERILIGCRQGLAAAASDSMIDGQAQVEIALGRTRMDAGRHEEALSDLKQGLRFLEQCGKGDGPGAESARTQIGVCLEEMGDLEGALRVHSDQLDRIRAEKPLRHASLVGAQAKIAFCLIELGDLERAEPILRSALELAKSRLMEGSRKTARARYLLGEILFRTDRGQAAIPLYRGALKTYRLRSTDADRALECEERLRDLGVDP